MDDNKLAHTTWELCKCTAPFGKIRNLSVTESFTHSTAMLDN